jgi:hypothetical protein
VRYRDVSKDEFRQYVQSDPCLLKVPVNGCDEAYAIRSKSYGNLRLNLKLNGKYYRVRAIRKGDQHQLIEFIEAPQVKSVRNYGGGEVKLLDFQREQTTTWSRKSLEYRTVTGRLRSERPFNREVTQLLDRNLPIPAPEMHTMTIGVTMEDTLDLMKAMNVEVEKAKEELQDVYDKVNHLREITHPAITQYVQELQALRMTLCRETKDCLTAMRDVRQFFIEHNYEVEMKRMHEFITMMHDLKRLKADGTLDAISDTVLKLSYGGNHVREQGDAPGS